MGRDKALLPWKSASLVEEVIVKVQAAAGNVGLVGEPSRYQHLQFDCLPDRQPGLGPLAGIESALSSRRGELNLIVACDMPGLRLAWLHLLLESAVRSGALCTSLVDSNGAMQPLCAVYRSDCLPMVQNALEERRLKLMDFVTSLDARTVFVPSPIWNVNTPEEWTAWQNAETH